MHCHDGTVLVVHAMRMSGWRLQIKMTLDSWKKFWELNAKSFDIQSLRRRACDCSTDSEDNQVLPQSLLVMLHRLRVSLE